LSSAGVVGGYAHPTSDYFARYPIRADLFDTDEFLRWMAVRIPQMALAKANAATRLIPVVTHQKVMGLDVAEMTDALGPRPRLKCFWWMTATVPKPTRIDQIRRNRDLVIARRNRLPVSSDSVL
jgi:hypothetical protein